MAELSLIKNIFMTVLREYKQRLSRTLQTHRKSLSTNNVGVLQCARNQGYETIYGKPEFKTYYFGGIPWDACTYREITIPPYYRPNKGTGTSGKAPWAGRLLDQGYQKPRNATRLHVINSNFGGPGGTYEGNLHPGSQRLNKNDLDYAENKFKESLENPIYDSSSLIYKCGFIWNPQNTNGVIPDPTIAVDIIRDNGINQQLLFSEIVPQGSGMSCSDNIVDTDVDADSDGND